MGDNKPPAQDRKLLYVAPLVIAGLIIAIGVATFFRQPPAAPVTQTPPVNSVTTKPAPTPSPPPPLTRADLIGAARDAADAFTVNGKLPGGTDLLVTRRFSIRIPFGCGGVQGGYGPAQISTTYSADNQSITLTATPGVWTGLPIMQAPGGDADIEAVEGFWIPRPWTYADSCPLQLDYPVPATPTPPTAQTLGLAQLFQTGGSRIQRHADHPYAFTRKLSPGDPSILTHDYRLLLEGKIAGYPGGQALRCWIEAPDHQPLCIFAVSFDHVAFEDATTGETLASWND